MASDCVILKESVNVNEHKSADLTTDCYFVHMGDGRVDLVRGSMVKIFDDFFDRKLTITRIQHAKGSLNPKLNTPRV